MRGGYRTVHEVPGTCPRCKQELVARKVGDVDTRACEMCHGRFMTAEALGALANGFDFKAAGEAVSIRVAPDAVPCPICAAPAMRTWIQRADVYVDACDEHGIWFDADELKAVARANPPPREPERGTFMSDVFARIVRLLRG